MISEIIERTGGTATTTPAALGLSHDEVLVRRAQGLGNRQPAGTTRTYRQIARQNAFTFINVVLYATSLALIVMGLWGDALVTAGLVLLNVAIAVAQEARAKRTLDHITLLTRPKVAVIRGGTEERVDPAELVTGDLVAVRPGDQLVTDGQVVGEERIDLDESLLTGESEAVTKHPGDPVYSGSFCVAGSGLYLTKAVGTESLANRLTAGAKAFRQEQTPLQRDVNLIIRIMVLVVVMVGGPVVIDLAVRVIDVMTRWADEPLATAIDHAYSGFSAQETVRAAAVVVAIVPQGLALMIVVTYAAAAVRLIGKGALVQQANAIESLSHVEVLCLDKTGTLTTNRIVFAEASPIGLSGDEFGRLLGDAIASASDRNRTAEAIATAFPGHARRVVEEVPFTSSLKWSAVAIDDAAGRGVFVTGAPDVLAPSLQPGFDLGSPIATWTAEGKRVLLFAYRPDGQGLHDELGEARLPANLIPLGLLAFVDELRPEARETLRRFAELGIRLKLISGDDPRTVGALAVQAGFPESIDLVSGSELDTMGDDEFAVAARDGTIFGRTTPQQKERLIQTLRDQGRYVAMIGDGVNDILAMKRANLAVAVKSGSPATRGVADLVLLNDSFAALPPAFGEGQRILGGMHDVVGLFLSRSLAVTAVILGAILAGAPFPITPKHNSVLALFAVGIPTLALAAWAKPERPRGRLLRAIAPFLVPAALTVAPVALTVYLLWWRVTGDVEIARTVLTTTLIGCGALLVLFVQPPTHFWVGGDEFSGDWRPAVMAATLLLGYLGVVFTRPLREIFELSPMTGLDLLAIAAVVTGWVVLVRSVWRGRWFERLFDLNGG